jgi:hypothetical protein
MRPHGRASINPRRPEALGVCDLCGFLYNHRALTWDYDWRGSKMQNLRILVCEGCLDEPQQNGQRSFILPPDPVPIANARPEYYVPDTNPLSAIGANPDPSRWQYSMQIGTLTEAGGVPAAFDGNPSKPSFLSATITTAHSSFGNYVGINWTGNVAALNAPSSMLWPVRTHTLASFTLRAPVDSTFGSTGYVIQGANVNAGWGSWTTLASGSVAGTVGEVITDETLGGRYQFHRAAFYGGASPISVAQVSFSVTDGSSN